MTTYYVSGTRVTDGAPIYVLNLDSLFVFQGAELVGSDEFTPVEIGIGNFVKVDGAIYADTADAIEVTGFSNEVVIGATGNVSSGEDGVSVGAGATGTTVTNYGQIYADEAGIETSIAMNVINGGVISGLTAVAIGGGVIINSGEISGRDTGVFSGGSSSLSVSNSGLISGPDFAIRITSVHGATIHNSGLIDGLVQTGTGADRIVTAGGRISGTVELDIGADTFVGGAFDDTVLGQDNADLLKGGAGDDALDGGLDNDRLRGQGGDDGLAGNVGADRLFGGDGQDLLEGGDGADVLTGERGDDSLTGGKNADSFVFRPNFGDDVVIDFKDAGPDQLVFSRNVFTDFADVQAHMRQVGADVLIEAEDGSSILLLTHTLGSLAAADFVFG